MRGWILRVFFLVISVDALLLVSDAFGVFQWVRDTMTHYPALAVVLTGPSLPLICMAICLLSIAGDKFFKTPELKAEYLRVEVVQRLSSLPIEALDQLRENIANHKPYGLEADFLVEIYLVNHSVYRVSIREFLGEIVIQRQGLARLGRLSGYFPKRTIKLTKAKEFSLYRLKRETATLDGTSQTKYVGLPDIETDLSGVALERGVGYRGWIGFTVTGVDRSHLINSFSSR